jgi:hypothetical protein
MKRLNFFVCQKAFQTKKHLVRVGFPPSLNFKKKNWKKYIDRYFWDFFVFCFLLFNFKFQILSTVLLRLSSSCNVLEDIVNRLRSGAGAIRSVGRDERGKLAESSAVACDWVGFRSNSEGILGFLVNVDGELRHFCSFCYWGVL